VVEIPVIPQTAESWLPVVFLLALSFLLVYSIAWFYTYPSLQYYLQVLGSVQHYKWLRQLLIRLKYFERFFYFLNTLVYISYASLRYKALKVNMGTSNQTLVLVVLLLMLFR
jgi:hypothetical protein